MNRQGLLHCDMLASVLLRQCGNGSRGAGTAPERRMKNKSRQLIGQLLLAAAICVMAAVGFVFIMERLTARTVGFQNMFTHRTAAPAAPGR
jgi:hypothetical protein